MPDALWTDPIRRTRVSETDALDRLASASVVLLGETHDDAQDHAWQTRVLAGLADRRQVVAGFEMFPRHARPALDDWVAGRLDPRGFLAATRWQEVWGFDPALYLPLFELCRSREIPMRGLNIDRPLVSLIGREGWDALPEAERGWLTPAVPAGPDYRRYLFEATGGVRPGRVAQSPEDPAFDRFVRAQQAWDRAFACALVEASAERPDALVVGIIGRGHLEYRLGVSPQLEALGVGPTLLALPSAPQDAGPIADLLGPSQLQHEKISRVQNDTN